MRRTFVSVGGYFIVRLSTLGLALAERPAAHRLEVVMRATQREPPSRFRAYDKPLAWPTASAHSRSHVVSASAVSVFDRFPIELG